MNSITRLTLLLGIVAALFASCAEAQYAKSNSVDAQIMTSDAFLGSHPDLRHRLVGLKAYQQKDYAKALTHFRRAARYGDKPSQGMLAEMYWSGMGVAVNRPLGYAWMDLAAERQFKVMLVNRERYWEALTEAERKQAVAVGGPLFAQYADEFAKPRLEKLLRVERRGVTGSRVGSLGSLTIIIPGPQGEITLQGREYYKDKFWKPDQYWAWQAEEWKELPRGRVEVGPLHIPGTK